jgi:hypothetical protein
MFRWLKKQEKQEDTDILSAMDQVSMALQHSREESLEVEVVTWALMFMKENPSLTVSEAITMGYFEWVK